MYIARTTDVHQNGNNLFLGAWDPIPKVDELILKHILFPQFTETAKI